MKTATNWVLNKQWALVIGAAATAISFGLTEYADAIPVEIVPIIAAIVTFLRVWSNDSVDELESQIPTATLSMTDIGDGDEPTDDTE